MILRFWSRVTFPLARLFQRATGINKWWLTLGTWIVTMACALQSLTCGETGVPLAIWSVNFLLALLYPGLFLVAQARADADDTEAMPDGMMRVWSCINIDGLWTTVVMLPLMSIIALRDGRYVLALLALVGWGGFPAALSFACAPFIPPRERNFGWTLGKSSLPAEVP